MNNKKIKKRFQILSSSNFKVNTFTDRVEDGIVYTIYSDKFNSIEVGFAENYRYLETKLSSENFILVGKKRGKEKELLLLINTLNELGIKYTANFNYKYSTLLMRHLAILGWPVGRSIYKQRKIKKELAYA